MTEADAARTGRRRRRRRQATRAQGAPAPTAAPDAPRPAAPAPVEAAPPEPAPVKQGQRRRGNRESGERGLRDIVGAGRSQVGVSGALRARDVNRPTADDLAEAERDVVIVRRNWKPPAS
jgi:hypothetical protein